MGARNPRLGNHHWLAAGLQAMGYNRELANVIAFNALTGKTLFPNEQADANRVLATLTPKG